MVDHGQDPADKEERGPIIDPIANPDGTGTPPAVSHVAGGPSHDSVARRLVWRIRHPQNYAAAVYGSVLAASVVISSGDLRAPGVLAVLLLSSGFVFWIAHVYAATVAGVHGGWHPGAIRRGMSHEWPLALAAVPPALAAVIAGLVPGTSPTEGMWAAFIVAIAEQQLWGMVAVRKAKLTGPTLTKTVMLNVFMGLIIVGLKLALPGH